MGSHALTVLSGPSQPSVLLSALEWPNSQAQSLSLYRGLQQLQADTHSPPILPGRVSPSLGFPIATASHASELAHITLSFSNPSECPEDGMWDWLDVGSGTVWSGGSWDELPKGS